MRFWEITIHCIHWLIMSSLIKTRVRRGPKAKSIAVLPRSLIALNLPQVSAPTEWIDEDIEEVQRKKKKLRKSFTREFKLCAITIVYGSRINAKGCEVPAVVTVFSHFFFFFNVFHCIWNRISTFSTTLSDSYTIFCCWVTKYFISACCALILNLKRPLFVSLFLSSHFPSMQRTYTFLRLCNVPALFCVSAAYVLNSDMDRCSPVDAVSSILVSLSAARGDESQKVD